MKQSPADALATYRELVERYHGTLDLISDRGLSSLDAMIREATRYGELIGSLRPYPAAVVDLGSGAGLPGVPIALSLPGSRVYLVERKRRRVSFLRIVTSRLMLNNTTVVHGDVASLSGVRAEVVTAQAVGTLAEVYWLTRHLHAQRVWLVSRKGPSWGVELRELEERVGSAAIEVREEKLSPHGRLVAVSLPGGSACPPSG